MQSADAAEAKGGGSELTRWEYHVALLDATADPASAQLREWVGASFRNAGGPNLPGCHGYECTRVELVRNDRLQSQFESAHSVGARKFAGSRTVHF